MTSPFFVAIFVPRDEAATFRHPVSKYLDILTQLSSNPGTCASFPVQNNRLVSAFLEKSVS
ncbi:AraC family transcriptional regulator [Desmospora sp. 8437]|nr:AraC family transcriptional regulator [Desmospora sp. 8437]